MLSYRHAFHAGNAADLHKHASLCLVRDALLRKPAACTFIDAYAGIGVYRLDADEARKTGEAADSLGRLFAAESLPDVLAGFRQALGRNGELPIEYPGSPEWIARGLRAQDELILLEMHPADAETLKARYRKNRQIHVHRRDAREGLPALLPPTNARGLVLVDPPYEEAREYDDVVTLLLAAVRRWPTGVFGLWYPLLDAARHLPMLDALKASGVRRQYRQELRFAPAASGLKGSGMLWVNLPWQVDAELRNLADGLVDVVGEPGANQDSGWLVGE